MGVSRRSITFLRWTLGVVFFWFGILKLFNASPVLLVIQKAMPSFLAHSQLFLFTLSLLEIVIGLSFLTHKFVRIFCIIMILHLIVATISVLVTQGFAPRFPIFSLEGEFVAKNIVLMAAGYILFVAHEIKKEEKK